MFNVSNVLSSAINSWPVQAVLNSKFVFAVKIFGERTALKVPGVAFAIIGAVVHGLSLCALINRCRKGVPEDMEDQTTRVNDIVKNTLVNDIVKNTSS